jgi:hypothetical protein
MLDAPVFECLRLSEILWVLSSPNGHHYRYKPAAELNAPSRFVVNFIQVILGTPDQSPHIPSEPKIAGPFIKPLVYAVGYCERLMG